MKIYSQLILFVFSAFYLSAQDRNALGVHIMPWASSESMQATGLYIDYDRTLKNKNYFFKIGYGIIYDNYDQPTYTYALPGRPERWSTEIEASNIPFPNTFWIPDPSLIENLNTSGFTNLKIYNSYRIDHFINFNFGYHFKMGKKWTFSPSAGVLLGFADRTIVAGAAAVTLAAGPGIPHPLIPSDLYFWVVFQLRGKYLYGGYNGRLDFDRAINPRFSVGSSMGCNFSVRKDFIGEQQFLYVDVNAKVKF